MRFSELVAPAHLAVAALIIAWDVFIAGQMVKLRGAPRVLTALTGLAALLVAPAVFVLIAVSLLETGRAISAIAWVWPACTVLFALQAVHATSRRLVSPLIGVPIALFDVLVATVAVARFMIFRGGEPPLPLLALSASHAASLGLFIGSMALSSPLALQIPILSPAFPARWRASHTVRGLLALYAIAWVLLVAVELPRGVLAVRGYERFADDRLTEHPQGDFDVGIKLFPDLDGLPPPVAVRYDPPLLDTLDVDAIALTLESGATRLAALDSIARLIEPLRRGDSTRLVVTIGYPGDAHAAYGRDPAAYTRARLADVDRVVRRLRPDILLPADAPYARGVRALDALPLAYWTDYLTRAAELTHRLRPRTQVGISAAAYDAADSALYAWAASPESPLDVVGFALYPGFRGELSLRTRIEAAERWMRLGPATPKPHWVFAAGGYPAVHGEASQERAVWGALAWATGREHVFGLIVTEPGDYATLTGLRSGAGRLRPVVGAVARAIRGLRESLSG
jgi:hypothetical protein